MLLAACNDSDDKTTEQQINPVSFNPVEASISDVHNSILSHGASCVQVVQSYLDRINAYDKQGPTLNSIITINPNALKDAQALDDYFKQSGKLKGTLHCVTVLPKDNIDTLVICAELAGDFHLGYARQLTDKSSLLFDLAF